MTTKKTKVIFLIIIGTLVLASFPVHAENCVVLGTSSELVKLIQGLFKWGLRIAGLITFGALILGGFMYLTSGGNKQRTKQARAYMTGAILGLVILLTSVLLLRTINPQLLQLGDLQAPPDHGVCFYSAESSGGTSTRCCYTESSKSMPEDFEAEKLKFRSKGKDLYGVYLFPTTSWGEACTYENNARGSGITTADVSGDLGSFYLDWNKLGVYLYPNTGSAECNRADFDIINKPYKLYQTSVSNLENYNNKVKSIEFRNLDCKNYGGYMAPRVGYVSVLHGETEQEGRCSIVGTEVPTGPSVSSDACTPRDIDNLSSEAIGYDASSMTVFNYNFVGPSTTGDSGRVTFYEKVGLEGNHFSITASDINGAENLFWSEEIEYPIGNQSWANVQQVGPGNDTMEQIMSIKIDGNFRVLLGKDSGVGDRYSFGQRCEVIKNTVSNLKEHYVLGDKNDDQINAIGIAPAKDSAD